MYIEVNYTKVSDPAQSKRKSLKDKKNLYRDKNPI